MLTDQQILAAAKQTFSNSFHKFVKAAFEVVNPGEVFKDNWHVEYICDVLQSAVSDVAAGVRKKHDIIINVPPRTLKSFIVAVCLPAWTWLFKPSMKFSSSSYSLTLSTEHSVLCRRLIESSWYQRMSGIRITGDQNQKHQFENTKRGSRLAFATGSTVTGRGGNVIIIDDPTNPEQALSEAERTRANRYFDETLSTRLNRPTIDIYIIIMQRLHEQDLTGWLLSKEGAAGRWRHIVIPAELNGSQRPEELKVLYTGGNFFPERFPADFLDRMKVSLGSYGYAGQYLQSPSPLGGGILKAEWFSIVEDTPEGVVNFVIDPAYTKDEKNDPSALMAYTTVNNQMYIHSVVSKHMEMPELIRYIKQFAAANGYSSRSVIYVEPKASGLSLVQVMRRETGLNIKEDRAPTRDKVSRVNDCTAFIESGRCHLVRGGWNEAFLYECSTFPNGKHDDQVDCLTMAIGKSIQPERIIKFI
jgi:predicted phage terminase large subunit-like protein